MDPQHFQRALHEPDAVRPPHRLFRYLPPVSRTRLVWQHFCHVPRTKKERRPGIIICCLVQMIPGLFPLIVIPPVSAVINPIMTAGYVVAYATGSWVPWFVSVTIWLVGYTLMRQRKEKGDEYVAVAAAQDNCKMDPTFDAEQSTINEEHWCRAGAETWTGWQRLKMHTIFAVAHEPSLVFMYGPQIVTHSLASYILTRVYLREYRRTNSRANALYKTAHAHFYANFLIDKVVPKLWWLAVGWGVLVVALYYFFRLT